MGRGSITDSEWKGSLATFVLFSMIFYALEAAITFAYLGLQSTVDFDSMPEEYAFHLRGNMSIFHPNVYNRTDQDESSPTYGMWTPPPGTHKASCTAMLSRPCRMLCGSAHPSPSMLSRSRSM